MLSQASMMPTRRDHRSSLQLSLPRGAFAKELCDIEVHEIRVVKNDRLNRALYLVAFMTMRGNNMQDFPGNLMFVCEGNTAKWMAQLLSEFSLNHFARGVLVVLERFTHVGQQCARYEMIALDGNAAAKRTLQHVGNGDALARARIKVFDKRHVDIASQQREFHRAQLIESPALTTASSGDGFAPDCCHFFAQRFIFDLHQRRKKFRNFFYAVVTSFLCHGDHLCFSRYF